MSGFNIHGSLTLSVEGSLLMLEGEGPWNLESLLKSGKDVAPLVTPLYGKPWGVVCTILGEPIYVPEAAKMLVDIVRTDKEKGRVASALLVNRCNAPKFAHNHISEIYNEAGEEFAFFDDIEEAKRWVNQKIAEVEQSS